MKPVGPDKVAAEVADELADELYGVALEDFTAARDAAARAAKEPAAAKAIKALRKPTAAAHAVNVLVRDRPDEIDELLAVGESLRAAMARGGGGGDVRQLTEDRRALIEDLVPADLAAAVRADVTATLEAATADPQLGAAVRSGRLVRPLRYAGFGALPDLGDAVATPPPAPIRATRRPKAAEKPAAARKAAPPAKPAVSAADLDAARQRVLDLAGAADDAQQRYEAAVRAATEARALLERAEQERGDAHRAARAAHAEVEKARRELGRLERS
jgi:hypothetical protein